MAKEREREREKEVFDVRGVVGVFIGLPKRATRKVQFLQSILIELPNTIAVLSRPLAFRPVCWSDIASFWKS